MAKSEYSSLIKSGNLKRQPSWFMNILISFDQLGNAIAGGNPDSTISARIGYFVSSSKTTNSKYWNFLETIVDFTFKPIDGENHCIEAYESDKQEEFVEGSILFKSILLVLVIFFCSILIIIIRVIVLFYPKIKCQFYLNGDHIEINRVNELRAAPLRKVSRL